MQLHAQPIVFIGVNDDDLLDIGVGLKASATTHDDDERTIELYAKFAFPHLNTGYFWQDIPYWLFDAEEDIGFGYRVYALTALGFTFSVGIYQDK